MTALDSLLAAGRAAHEAIMFDTVRLVRPGADVYNPDTGETTQPAAQTLYTGPARVKPAQAVSETADFGQRLVIQRRYEVAVAWGTLPAGVDRILAGDQVIVTGSPNPRLPGIVLWVTSVGESATATAWRLSTEDRS